MIGLGYAVAEQVIQNLERSSSLVLNSIRSRNRTQKARIFESRRQNVFPWLVLSAIPFFWTPFLGASLVFMLLYLEHKNLFSSIIMFKLFETWELLHRLSTASTRCYLNSPSPSRHRKKKLPKDPQMARWRIGAPVAAVPQTGSVGAGGAVAGVVVGGGGIQVLVPHQRAQTLHSEVDLIVSPTEI
ncbi:hypothetical protein Bca4012_015373 [Brassica carinata]